MLFMKKKPPAPSLEQVAAIDNVVDVDASIVEPGAEMAEPAEAQETDSFSPPPAVGGGFSFKKKDALRPVAASAAAPKKPLFQFGRKDASSGPPLIEEIVQAAPKAKKPMFSFAKKDAASETAEAPTAAPVKTEKSAKAPKAPKATKAPKAAKAPKASKGKASKNAVLCLDVGSGGAPVFWTLSAENVDTVETPTVGRALSFSPLDHVVIADEPMSRSSAADLSVGELGEDVHVVNSSKLDGIVLATPKDRTHGKPLRLAPGSLALAKLLRSQPKPETNCVVGFDLRGESQHVLILFVWGPEGLTREACQVSVNASDVGFTVSQFAASRRINAEDVRTILFDNRELLSVAGVIEAYPNETIFLGAPAGAVLNVAAAVAVVVAMGAGSFAFTQYQKVQDATQSAKRAAATYKNLDAELGKLLEERFIDFTRNQSVDVKRSMQRAIKFWVPGTTLSLDAKVETETYEMAMKLQRGPVVGTRPSVAQALTPKELAALVDLTVPAETGCSRDGLFVNGSLNEVQLTVTCKNPPSAFGRYRLD